MSPNSLLEPENRFIFHDEALFLRMFCQFRSSDNSMICEECIASVTSYTTDVFIFVQNMVMLSFAFVNLNVSKH